MIDTDKYEGHTPAPWNITVSVFKGKYILEEATDPTDANEVCANADLMQDAPLLLEEVKRLRKQNKLMVDYFRFMRDGGLTDEDWRTINEWIGDEKND